MAKGTYPGRRTRKQWLALSIAERCLLAARAQSDLLGLWPSCSKKPCRRRRACAGDERCRLRTRAADFAHPDFGQPGFKSSFRYPDHLRVPSAILDQLPFLREPSAPRDLVKFCAEEAGAEAAAALRRIFGLEKRRRPNKRRVM